MDARRDIAGDRGGEIVIAAGGLGSQHDLIHGVPVDIAYGEPVLISKGEGKVLEHCTGPVKDIDVVVLVGHYDLFFRIAEDVADREPVVWAKVTREPGNSSPLLA